MRCLITGAGGFIGGQLLRATAAAGYEAIGLSRSAVVGTSRAGISWMRGDLRDPDTALAATRGTDVVYHAAGTTLASAGSPGELLSNVDITRNVLNACRVNAVKRLVVVSSVAVYRPRLGSRVDESAPLGGVDLYGRAKAQAEEVIQLQNEGEVPHCIILRSCQVFGDGDRSGFTDRLLRLVQRRWAVVPIGEQRLFSLVHVEDLIDAILRAGAADQVVVGAFNITGPDRVSLQSLRATYHAMAPGSPLQVPIPACVIRGALATRWLGRALGSRSHRPVLRSYRPGEVHGSILLGGPEYDIDRATTILGYRPRRRFEGYMTAKVRGSDGSIA